jgi:hypothetical protein
MDTGTRTDLTGEDGRAGGIRLIDVDRYPLHDPSAEAWVELIARVRRDLATDGCCVLDGFVRPEMTARLRAESEALAPAAHHTVETVNVYNVPLDADLPGDHPGRITMERGNAFVARDLIPADALVHRLYVDGAFQRFVASCFALDEIHPLADPLAGLCLNVIAPGRQHPWHFDTNEFTVSLLTVEQEAGGRFEYCPGIRSAASENLDAVRAVLEDRGDPRPRRLHLRPGDLQLFTGRYSLHRVSTVHGATARHSAIFAYTARPGIVGSVERTRQLFGRVLPVHRDAERAVVAVDSLLD